MGKVLTDYLADLRLDLKDSATLWSNAELTRCVERAVADYSRFSPRERTYELTVDLTVENEAFTSPTASDNNLIVAAKDISASVAGDTCTIADGSPDIARPVMITLTDANDSITVFTLIVKGRDSEGVYQEEYFYISGGKIQTGKKYFSMVTEVEIDEITGNGAADVLDVGTGSHLGVWVELVNYPIKFESEAITGYTRNTHYEMDYLKGRIRLITGTTMAAATAYTLTEYTKSGVSFNLEDLSDIIRIDRVEYPAHAVPQTFAKISVWNNILTIVGSEQDSQAEVSDEQHILIYYLAKHMPPTTAAPGTYPDFMDWTMELAASAYALMIKAIQYEHQAVTDFASSRTSLTSIAAAHTLATAALAKVITYLESNSNEDAKYWMTKITTDIANLRTAIQTALGAAATDLAAVYTTSLDKATTGAEALLDAGDNFIDAINDGSRVPENYREYAQTRAMIADARLAAAGQLIQEAAARLANLNSYLAQSAGWGNIATGFVEEASGHLGNIDRYLQEAASYQQVGAVNLQLADRFRNEANERRNEAYAIWGSPPQYSPMYNLGMTSQPAT